MSSTMLLNTMTCCGVQLRRTTRGIQRYRCSFFERADGSVSAKVIPTNVIKVCVREKEMKVGCGRPYNPDRFMLRCSKCDKLFHPECLQIPVSEYRAQPYKPQVSKARMQCVGHSRVVARVHSA